MLPEHSWPTEGLILYCNVTMLRLWPLVCHATPTTHCPSPGLWSALRSRHQSNLRMSTILLQLLASLKHSSHHKACQEYILKFYDILLCLCWSGINHFESIFIEEKGESSFQLLKVVFDSWVEVRLDVSVVSACLCDVTCSCTTTYQTCFR